MTYQPPVTITREIIDLVESISRLIGRWEGIDSPPTPPALRLRSMVETISSTLAIEGNTLTAEQVTTILQGRNVDGTPREVQEVRNAISVYEDLGNYSAGSLQHLLAAHGKMMAGLIDNPGKLRDGDVRVVGGGRVRHVPPPASRVESLMHDLFEFIHRDESMHPLVRGCALHYEIELIHPFEDGNGRMGRLWQQLLFIEHHRLFEHVPVEHAIHENQAGYYEALQLSDSKGESTVFVAFCLSAARDSLEALLAQLVVSARTPSARLEKARDHFDSRDFSRAQYLKLHTTISTATASRDLAAGVESGALQRTGHRATTRYRFSVKDV